MKLTAELVPQTVWYKSLAKLLPRSVWNNLRQEVIKLDGLKCQICGETKGVFNLHEIWRYDDVNHVQSLDGFVLLCTMCHHVKHIGLAGILADKGKLDYDKLSEHFCHVLGFTVHFLVAWQFIMKFLTNAGFWAKWICM